MKPEWKEFLENKGAEFEDGKVDSFGNPERELRIVTSGDILADLSHTGLISVHGEDAETFLQGQLTNDVRQTDESHSQLSAYCSPKGRMLANFRLFKRNDTFYLHMPREQVDAALKRLRMYLLASKATLEDASDHFVRVGFSGPHAASQLQDHLGAIPGGVDEVVQTGDMTVIRIAGPHPRFEIYGELDSMKQLWTTLDVRAAPVGNEPWSALDIMAGIPTIYPETADAFVPQMANMQLVNGVSFKKGCYTGQEVVARMQYLGKLKRRMYRARIDSEDCPAPGTALVAAGSTSGQGAGKVVNAQPSPDGGCEMLAVVEISSAEGSQLHVGNDDGPVLEWLEMPYPLENDSAADKA